MESFVARMQKLDAHRLALAPLLGLLAGFLVNRAHDGSAGWALLAEMGAGAIMVSFGAAVMSNVSRLMEDRDQEAALLATAEQQAVLERKRAMVEAEAERYRNPDKQVAPRQSGRFLPPELAAYQGDPGEAETRQQFESFS